MLEIGGEFDISLATHHYFAASALSEIEGGEPDTTAELEAASSLYAAGPRPGEQHWFGGKAQANIDLATIRLRSGELEAAAVALGPVLTLPPGQRIRHFAERLTRVRAELAGTRYQGSPQAKDLDEQIEAFTRETLTTELGSLSGGPG